MFIINLYRKKSKISYTYDECSFKNQNILDLIPCIENDHLNILWTFQVSTMFYFE